LVIVLVLAGLALPLSAREAAAADPRLVRVVLLRVADRMTVALEMSSEPQKAALRVLSSRAVEIEAGPVSGLFRDEQLAPSDDVRFIRHVMIQKHTPAGRASYVRARVTFDAPGAGNVRVVGRTVYVDVTPIARYRPQLTAPVPPRSEPRMQERQEERQNEARPPQRASAGRTPSTPINYEQAVRPFVARLSEIGPFLASAAASPSDDVLVAMGGTLAEVEHPLRSMDVPQSSRPLHNVLLSAVTTASRAFARDFTGDRVAQVQRALALLDAAKSEIR
jgi:hypothetical protein